MNIQQSKSLTNTFLLVFATLLFIGCKTQQEKGIIEVLTGVEVESQDCFYSDESVFKLGEKVYSLRSKATYSINGDVQKLDIYKSEGVLSYDSSDLFKDAQLMEYYNLPLHQSFKYSDGFLKINPIDKIKVVSVENYLLYKNDDLFLFYKSK